MTTNMNPWTRREILLGTAAASLAAASPAAASPAAAAPNNKAPGKPTLCLFSKHLPYLGYKDLARTLRELGFPGVDLTTRAQGHVLPERVAEDLPKAFAALQNEGIELAMITTGLTSPSDPTARPTLETAAQLKVPFWKLGYYRYQDLSKLDDRLNEVKRDVEGLAAASRHAGICGGFHNHSGTNVGSAMWDHWWVLRDTDPQSIGFYFDPCHATIEGGEGGWQIGFHRLTPGIHMVAIKDFYWEKQGGKWQVRMCPLGEGMVNFPKFFQMLAASGFSGPISMHVEYEIDGPTEAAKREKELAAIQKDYAYLKPLVEKAFNS
jgi:sugar phosphate isomerase/epimerase